MFVGLENHRAFHRYVQRAYKARLQRVVIAKLTPMGTRNDTQTTDYC